MRYKISKILGRGSFGCVKEAETDDGRTIAIKIYERKPLDDVSSEILREINNLIGFSHPHIIKFMQVSIENGNVEIAMEHGGKTLSEYMFTLLDFHRDERAPEIFTQILSAVSYMHKVGVIHRDIKPDNILIRKGVARLCDFSIAKKTVPFRRNANTYKIGTINYKPPELFSDKSRDYGTKVDIWSLGCTFYEFLTKNVLFKGNTEISVITRILRILQPDEKELQAVGLSNIRVPSAAIYNTFDNVNIMKDLIEQMVRFHPHDRISCTEALRKMGDGSLLRTVDDAVKKHSDRRYNSCFIIKDSALSLICKQIKRNDCVELMESMQNDKSEKQTLLIAINIFDKYITHHAVSNNYVKKNWDIISHCCYFISSKYIELRPIQLSQLCCEYSAQEIINCELHILKLLKFNISDPTLLDIYKIAMKTPITDDHWNVMLTWIKNLDVIINKSAHELKLLIHEMFSDKQS